MANYQIPEEFLNGFKSLATFNSKEIVIVCKIMNELPVGAPPKILKDQLNSQLNLKDSVSIDLSTTLFSFGDLLTSSSSTVEKLSKEVAISYSNSSSKPLSESNLNALETNLTSIFNNCNNLKTTFKALSLVRDNGNIYHEARVISDIRLIFNDDLLLKDRSAMIIHQLKLSYYNEDIEKETYISLDKKDLNQLKDQIDRALEKEKAITETYKDMTFINLD